MFEQQLTSYTEEIVKQIQAAIPKEAGEKQLHFTMLITDSSSNQQDIMLKISKKVGDKLGCIYSYVPTNIEGVMRSSVVAPELQQLATKKGTPLPEGKNINKATRVANAARISLFVIKTENRINVVFCASGQARTGTEEEDKSQRWAVEQYTQRGIKITQAEMEAFRVLGCHNVYLASHQRPGAPCLKKDSRVYFFHFSGDTQEATYRKEAEQNKNPKVDREAVHRLRLMSTTTEHKDKKDAIISDDTIRNLAARIGSFYLTYSSTMGQHTSLLDTLKNKVEEIFKDPTKKYPTASAKLIAIAELLQKIWNDAAAKKSNGAAYPKDALIGLVNVDPSHTTWLRIGETLQEMKDAFPQALAKFSVSEHNERIIPEKLILHHVLDHQIETFKNQLAQCQTLIAPKKDEKLDAIVESLKTTSSLSEMKKDELFSRAMTDLNEIWKQITTDYYKQEKPIASLFSKSPDMFTKSESHIGKLNHEDKASFNYSRAVATILQNMNKEFGNGNNIIRPPIRTLEQPFEFKKTPKPTAPIPTKRDES